MTWGEAGLRGPKVRSDCWVGVELLDAGGLQIEVQSLIERLYGAAIHRQVEEGLATLGVEHARVEVEDGGALPFALDARLEAAVRAANPALKHQLLSAERVELTPSRRNRFRRSRLYLPGNTPKLMVNAGLHGADGIILDLEDSVAPVAKDAARCIIRNAIRVLDFRGAEVMVRINQGPRGLDDLEWVIPHGAQLILIPKVEDVEQVRHVEERISNICDECGREDPVWLMPIIESALGALRTLDIASASPQVVALAIGLEDYTADLGVQRTNEGTESFWMRGQVINAARAAGVQPIDTVFSDVADMEGLKKSVEEAKTLGFDGKGCIHPRQIGIVNSAFAPSAAEIAKARRIVLAFDEAEKKGLGVVSLGSKMIDPPVVKRALHTVNLAIATGVLAADWREAQ
ncbi:MAG: HpcH/HpaI aldolase/citrate lyase family protein [Proteobacteria bacterium]|jgi:citrate lyase subunit beta / citryl-CoA lyase|nr:HpcH/HpaI aldolase/citrate lyase family protein [Pseudomonadota bacterium]